jgi:hypothetical protein
VKWVKWAKSGRKRGEHPLDPAVWLIHRHYVLIGQSRNRGVVLSERWAKDWRNSLIEGQLG